MGLVEVRVSWPGHPRLSKKKISEQDESPRSFGTKQLELRSVTYNATKGFHFSSLYILQQAPKLSIQGL